MGDTWGQAGDRRPGFRPGSMGGVTLVSPQLSEPQHGPGEDPAALPPPHSHICDSAMGGAVETGAAGSW